MSTARRRTGVISAALAALVVAPAAPAWAAADDRLLLVEQSVWRAEVRQADGAAAAELVAGAPDLSSLAQSGAWLPDASAVVLHDQPQVAPGRPGEPRLLLVARDGSTRRTLTTGAVTGAPDVSPDGRLVAFPSGDDVAVVGTDGTGRRTLLTGPADGGVSEVRWSPDGRSLAYLATDVASGATSLWRRTGTTDVRVSDAGERVVGSVGWHPDGTALVYAVQRDAGPVVRTAGLDGSSRELGAGQDPAWSPDGTRVALVDGRTVRVVDAADGAEVASWSSEDTGCRLAWPTWSPDSAEVAFSAVFTGAGCTTDARVLDVADGTVRPVPGVRQGKYGHRLTYAPLPTTAPAARSTAHACPDGRVPEDGFADTRTSVFEADVDCVAWYGLARGNGTGFAPGAPVTRTQTALFLARLLDEAGVALDTTDAGFRDTAGLSAEARDAVNAVANAGVARGTSATTFTPGAPVTRGQLASFLVRLQGEVDVPLPGRVHCFHDAYASVHRAAAEQLCAAGVALGDGKGTFGPGLDVTRGQVAGLLARSLDLAVAAGRLSPPA